jgi:hypothetical protein
MIPAIDGILSETRRTKSINIAGKTKEHLKISKIAKFGCELL